MQRTWNRFDPRSNLAARLGWIAGIASFLLAALISIIIGNTARQQIATDIGTLQAQLADQLAGQLDNELFIRMQELNLIAALVDSQSSTTRAEDKRAMLDKLRSVYPEFTWITVADGNGRVVTTTGAGSGSADASGEDWFTQGRTGLWVSAVNVDGSSAAEDGGYMVLSMPTLDDAGAHAGVLGARLGWRWARTVEGNLFDPLRQQRDIETFVVSRDGQVLLAPRGYMSATMHIPAAPDTGVRTAQLETWPDGVTYLTGYSFNSSYRPYAGLGWAVLVRERADAALAPADALRSRVFSVSLLIGLGAAVLIATIIRRVTTPLNQIARAADQLRRSMPAEIPLVAGSDEVARLSRSLRGLVDTLDQQQHSLQQLNESLEARVKERTREIERLSADARQAAITRERLRMARDLHDTLAHTLAGLLTQIRLTERLIGQPDVLRAELERAERAARTGLQEARGAIQSLRTSAVAELGLQNALQLATESWSQRTGLGAEFETCAALQISPLEADALYRIAIEALRNIERHASPSGARVSLDRDDGARARLRISDDGAGFDPRDERKDRFGLAGMREHAELVGARLHVTSEPGHGTLVEVTL